MSKKNLYIIAGCNGAGKTTASFNILPDTLNCTEFVNADEIARGISPFNPDAVALESGRLMLERINDLMKKKVDFAFETTLSTRSYVNKVKFAQKLGYHVTLLFYWLESPELAIKRVELRVKEGGHNIPTEVIKRRYIKGIKNLFNLYIHSVDYTLVFDNSTTNPVLILESENKNETIHDRNRFNSLTRYL